MATAIARTVTTYTRPGDHVRLLQLASREQSGPAPRANRGDRVDGLGLLDHAWTVLRLGRRVRVLTTSPDATESDFARSDAAPFAEFVLDLRGPGLRSVQAPGRDESEPDQVSNDRVSSRSPRRPGRDRAELIIAVVDPTVLPRLDIGGWRALLSPHSTLAVITHGDHRDGVLRDATGPVVRAARHCGLVWLDHIVLPHQPLPPAPDGTTAGFSDLLTFRLPAGGSARSRRETSDA
ncbi:hypothetical protein NLX83_15785 [Allokutzneria sp. A3M-2-11 16]|uniref:hypothetical protein n=1 Tax=Allokutzneria sp. A3M-2-11 16 TaxID=2962043 RepID=UPI0020B8CF7C|nr:hypothetical protein [Allokutzneria sp. A3M-2-11 16]MCP3800729.1 hypothetical protein [Allokutzneria sp. A3M-2-11 16]